MSLHDNAQHNCKNEREADEDNIIIKMQDFCKCNF